VSAALAIRPARPADNGALAVIIRAGLAEYHASGPGTGFDDPALDDLAAAYVDPRAAYFAVEVDGALAGGGGVAPLTGGDGSVCELQRMYLSPAARGRGAGRRLLAHCLDFARAAGYRRCYLETMPEMAAAQRLYEGVGFQRRATRDGATGHCRCTAFYELALAP